MAHNVVQSCPLNFLDWSKQASSSCNKDTYHCVEDEYSRIVEVCTSPLWIEAGHCPVYNTVAKKMDSVVCSGKFCPKEMYRSDVVYKYPSCQLSASRTTSISTTVLPSTALTTTSITSTIAGSVIPVLLVIILVVLGFYFWRKKRECVFQYCCFSRGQNKPADETCESEKLIEDNPEIAAIEKRTPKELDREFISECEYYLKGKKNMMAMFGKLGTGKRTLATQVAIRLAKKEPKSKIRIVGERDLVSKDFELTQSTILIIHDPVKTCYTVSYSQHIIQCLLNICKEAPKQSYILVIFHNNDLDSLYSQFGRMKEAFKRTFQNVLRICNDEQTLSEIVKSNGGEISDENIKKIQGGSHIGESIILTLYTKASTFQSEQFLSNPVEFIIKQMKALQTSCDIHDQSSFKLLVYVILHGGEIAKSRLKDMPNHALFKNLRENMDKEDTSKMDEKEGNKINEETIKACIDKLLDLYIEEAADGRCYRVLHDVITKCAIISAFENHMALLFKECDLALLFDCIRLKSIYEKITHKKELVYDYKKLKIAIPTNTFTEIARFSFERKEIMDAFQNINLFEDKDFQIEWNKEQENVLKNKGEMKTS